MGKIVVALLCVSIQLSFAESFEELAAQATAARVGNDTQRAQSLYRQALAEKPEWAEGWFFLGTLSYDADQYAACQEAFTRFVKLDTKTAAAWSFLGLCEFETGDYRAALEHLQHSQQFGTGLPPEMLPAIGFHEAQLLARTGLFEEAMKKYITLAQQGSHSAPVLSGIGLAALRTPMLVKDIPDAQQNEFSSAGAAVYLWIAGQSELARKAFIGFLTRFDSSPNVHYLYGSYLIASDPDQALAEFQRELKLNPGCAEARALIAQQLDKRDEEKEAFEYAERAALDGPTVPLAQYEYGLLLTRRGSVRQAISRLEAAVKLDPRNLEYHLALGDAYSRFGRVAEALRERQLAITLAKENS